MDKCKWTPDYESVYDTEYGGRYEIIDYEGVYDTECGGRCDVNVRRRDRRPKMKCKNPKCENGQIREKERYCLIPAGMDNYWFHFCDTEKPKDECEQCPEHKTNKHLIKYFPCPDCQGTGEQKEGEWRKEFQYLLDRKMLSRDELAYLFGQIKSILQAELALHRWIPVGERLPENYQKVGIIISGKNNNGKAARTVSMANYIGEQEVLAEDWLDDDCSQSFYESCYDKENDCYWSPSGFYEYQFGGEKSYFVGKPVTHWKPIILPKQEKENERTNRT